MNKVILKTKKYSKITLIIVTSFIISTIIAISQRAIINPEEIAVHEEILQQKTNELNELEKVIEEKEKSIEDLQKYIDEKSKVDKKVTSS